MSNSTLRLTGSRRTVHAQWQSCSNFTDTKACTTSLLTMSVYTTWTTNTGPTVLFPQQSILSFYRADPISLASDRGDGVTQSLLPLSWTHEQSLFPLNRESRPARCIDTIKNNNNNLVPDQSHTVRSVSKCVEWTVCFFNACYSRYQRMWHLYRSTEMIPASSCVVRALAGIKSLAAGL